ncbi:competence protein ComEC [Pseudodesulfovibrio sp.]|nr:competence protein ComEC [Pseudodesulfovibrio sp.]
MTTWISDPIFWFIALPALAITGVLIQMVLSLFSCCGSFKLRGKPVLLKWWMIPAAAGISSMLWALTVLYVAFS